MQDRRTRRRLGRQGFTVTPGDMAMAKLSRKLWIGIGAVSIAGAPLSTAVRAQTPTHTGHQPANSQEPAAASATPAEGGEAYLTDGGPRDTRIRFYRDIA